MKTINASKPFSREAFVSRVEAAKALAFFIAKSGNELLESEFIAWIDRFTANASPVVEGCAGPNGWHDHSVTLRDAQGNEMICRAGGLACVPQDEWTSKLT